MPLRRWPSWLWIPIQGRKCPEVFLSINSESSSLSIMIRIRLENDEVRGMSSVLIWCWCRAKAVPILKEWGMDVDGLATSAGVKSRGDVTASATGDLLDLGESGKP